MNIEKYNNMKGSESRLDFAAQSILEQASSSNMEGVFHCVSAGSEDISILHQQMRATNLAWALTRIEKIPPGTFVAVVGGSFTGVMLSVLLTLQNNCVVLLFEKGKLLERFRRVAHRYLDKNLINRDFDNRHDLEYQTPIFESPVFKYEGGYASDVRHEWLGKFNEYRRRLNIITFEDTEIKGLLEDESNDELKFRFKLLTNSPEDILIDDHRAHLIIDATGYGIDAKYDNVPDFSYWNSGHELIYQSPRAQKILISGQGDSAIVELLHYTFKDFEHREIQYYMPQLGRWLSSRLRATVHRQLMDRVKDMCGLSNLLVWYHDIKPMIFKCGAEQLFANVNIRNSIVDILNCLDRELIELGVLKGNEDLASYDDSYVSEGLHNLDDQIQDELAERVRRKIKTLASYEIAEIMGEIFSPEYGDKKLIDNAAEMLERNRAGIKEITVIGSLPTAYSSSQSPIMYWYIALLTHFSKFTYKQARLSDVAQVNDGYEATLISSEVGNEDVLFFDRVAVRHGVDQSTTFNAKGSVRRVITPLTYDWMLDDWWLVVESKGRRFNVATKAVERTRKRIFGSADPEASYIERLSLDSSDEKFKTSLSMFVHGIDNNGEPAEDPRIALYKELLSS